MVDSRDAQVLAAAEGPKIVVGADGQIGAGLASFLADRGIEVERTTRQESKAGAGRPFFDLECDESLNALRDDYSCAFICAGMTAISACEREPARSRLVNVESTLRLAQKLYAGGARIVFLSSNTVFDGKRVRPDEDADCGASTEYGRQKVAVERELLSWTRGPGSVAVVRLTKVLSPVSGLARDFVEKLRAGRPCMAFRDLSMSPVSLPYVSESLLKIAGGGVPGIFHVSGSEEMTYAEFARRLAKKVCANPSLVRECGASDAGMEVLFRPDHPALGMRRTSEVLGIGPETVSHLMDVLTRPKV